MEACSSTVILPDLGSCPYGLLDLGRVCPEPQKCPSVHITPYCSRYIIQGKQLKKLEKRMKTTVLSQEIQETKCQRKRLLKDSKQLLEEKRRVQAENQLFMEYLHKDSEQCERKQEALWKQCARECAEIDRRRQELASGYTQRNAALQAQLLRGRKTQEDLKQQLRVLRTVHMVKERQDVNIETWKKEKEKIRGETAAQDQEAHIQFLREKALMEKELEELRLMELGQISTKGLARRKHKAWARACKQAHFEFCDGLHRENQQLRKELQQLSQEYSEVEAARVGLEKQLKLLTEEQWYLEALIRGRQRLQAETRVASRLF